MTVRKIWITKEKALDEKLVEACGSDRVLATLLNNRGIDSAEKVSAFLNPLKAKLCSPDVFSDMQKSADRIKSAIDNKEHITVYGDFDADGITSTALLYLTLKKIGADVDVYLPDRESESHGLNTKALVKIISKQKSRLIITVDCGITNTAEINFAKGFKTDVIITDHHEAPEILPDAYAILNPKAQDSLIPDLNIDEIQSLNYLAGVGVAFKLACKLLEMYECENYVHELLPLAAVGTIGDVVELIGENRSIVEMGLELIRNGKHKGIQKILSETGISDIKLLTSENIAFGIVPRLNASGRLESPYTALKVLISDDNEEINNNVKLLNDLNSLRQELCDETFNQAKELYEKDKQSNKKSIILFNENWHIGIIGIVSSKLTETYYKPVFLMTRDANNPNIIRCSCRSINTINIYDVLSQHKDIYEGFGGHKMAAGFSFDENKIKFNDFKKLLNKTIDEYTKDIDFSKTIIEADMVVEPEDITIKTIESINRMQPFGAGNPTPVFIMNNLSLKQFKQMGQNNNHLKIFAAKNNFESIECVKWNTPDFNLPLSSKIDILFSPKINEFNGNITIQYMISDIHSEYIKEESPLSDLKILDHRNKKDIINQVLDFISATQKSTCIFAESPKLKSKIAVCDKAASICFDMDNIPEDKEQLMFFECPALLEDFIQIINTTGAKIIHLMNFNIHEINTDNYLSTLSGMLKYAVSNLNGIFETAKLSKALNINEETIVNTLNLFDDIEMIDLNQISEDKYKITFLQPLELSKIKQNELYSAVEEQINEINTFRKIYLNATVEEIKEIL